MLPTKELWRFLWKIQGSIEIIDDWKQERCENDMFLMRQVCSMNITKAQFVSEILDHDRHKLHYDILNLNTSLQVEERFPRIEAPLTYWTTWSKALAAIKQAIPSALHVSVQSSINIESRFLPARIPPSYLKKKIQNIGPTNSYPLTATHSSSPEQHCMLPTSKIMKA